MNLQTIVDYVADNCIFKTADAEQTWKNWVEDGASMELPFKRYKGKSSAAMLEARLAHEEGKKVLIIKPDGSHVPGTVAFSGNWGDSQTYLKLIKKWKDKDEASNHFEADVKPWGGKDER